MNSRSKFLGISGTTLHMDFIGHTSYPVVRKGVELREEGEERRGKRGGEGRRGVVQSAGGVEKEGENVESRHTYVHIVQPAA